MTKASSDNTTALRLGLAVGAGFILMAIAWTVLFVAARHAHVEAVPLAVQPGRP